MIKVVLIDDEQSVLIGLRYLIDWGEQGFEIAATFQNPRQALSELEAIRPQLVITDIEMPEISGLDLITSLRELLPDSIFAILSAYDDFKYAQKAVQLGVFRYLLKPLAAESLLELLRDAKMRLSAESSSSSELNLVRSFVVRELLLTGTELSQAATLPYYRAMLHEQSYQLLLVNLPPVPGRSDPDAAAVLRERLHPENLFTTGDLFTLLLTPANAPSTGEMAQLLTSLGASYRLSDPFTGLQNGHVPFLRLSQELRESLFWGESVPAAAALSPEVCVEEIRQKLLPAVWDSENAELESAFFSLLSALRAHSHTLSKSDAVTVYGELLAAAEEVYQSLCQHRYVSRVNVATLAAQPDLDSLHALALDTCRTVLAEARSQVAQSNPTLVQKAKDFLQAHYSDPEFRLSDTADALFVNYSYLSHLFKTETNTTLFSYLFDLRMNQAKLLLSNPNLSVNDIAHMVGYTSTKTFYSTFKKAFSQSPRSYQRSLHKK